MKYLLLAILLMGIMGALDYLLAPKPTEEELKREECRKARMSGICKDGNCLNCAWRID